MFEKPKDQESNEAFQVGDEVVLVEEAELGDASNINILDPSELDKLNITERFPVGTRGVVTLLPQHEGTVHVQLEGREHAIAISRRKIKRLGENFE